LITKEESIKHQIHASEVLVIVSKGEQLGLLALHEALKQVEAQELDLVEVAPDAQPPVCRMMDYGKFRYEQKKKSHGPKKHAVVEIKEVKMGSRTDAHDVEHK